MPPLTSVQIPEQSSGGNLLGSLISGLAPAIMSGLSQPIRGGVSMTQAPQAPPQTSVQVPQTSVQVPAQNTYSPTTQNIVQTQFKAPNPIQTPAFQAPQMPVPDTMQMSPLQQPERLPLLAQAQYQDPSVMSDASYPTPGQLWQQANQQQPLMANRPQAVPQYQQNPYYAPGPGIPMMAQPAPQYLPPPSQDSADLRQARQWMQEQYRNNQIQNIAPPQVMPLISQGSSWRDRMMMGAAGFNKSYQPMIQAQDAARAAYNKAQMEAYIQQMKEAQQNQAQLAREFYSTASQNQRHEQDRQDELAKNKYADPEAFNSAMNFLAREYPSPSPARTEYIRQLYMKSGGALNLYQFVDQHFQRGETMQQARELTASDKQQKMQQRAELFPLMKQRMAAGAMLASDRAEVYRATKEAHIELETTKAMIAKLKLAEQQEYGDEMRKNQLALQRAQLEKVADQDEKQLRTGAHMIVNDYNRLESQRMAALNKADAWRKDDEIREAYGERQGAITRAEATDQAYEKMHVKTPAGFKNFDMNQKRDFFNSLPPQVRANVSDKAQELYHAAGTTPVGVSAAQKILGDVLSKASADQPVTIAQADKTEPFEPYTVQPGSRADAADEYTNKNYPKILEQVRKGKKFPGFEDA